MIASNEIVARMLERARVVHPARWSGRPNAGSYRRLAAASGTLPDAPDSGP
jgi:hypothetical protein